MKFSFILITLLFFPVNQIRDKEGPVYLHGIIMESGSFNPLPDSRILINNKFEATSDAGGSFSLIVLPGDTVTFTRMGFKDTRMVISDSLANKTYTSGVFLDNDTISIDEVIIIPRPGISKYDILNPVIRRTPEMENAKYNMAVSAYMGRNRTGSLGDPESNYNLIHQKQKIDAFEKGGIPSDRIIGLNPLILLPAVYLLIHGLPEKPEPVKRDISDSELEMLKKEYIKHQDKQYAPDQPVFNP